MHRVSGIPRRLSNGNVQVETWQGLWELPSDGSINDEVFEAFTTGHCHSLALALNKLTGWPIYGAGAPWDTEDSPAHVFVKHPSGRFVDITGFMDANKEGSRWLKKIYNIHKVKDAYNLDAYFDPQPKFAMPYAKTVLANVGGLMPAGAGAKAKTTTKRRIK